MTTERLQALDSLLADILREPPLIPTHLPPSPSFSSAKPDPDRLIARDPTNHTPPKRETTAFDEEPVAAEQATTAFDHEPLTLEREAFDEEPMTAAQGATTFGQEQVTAEQGTAAFYGEPVTAVQGTTAFDDALVFAEQGKVQKPGTPEEETVARPAEQAKALLAGLNRDTAIRLRWAMRDIKAKRTKLTPVSSNDLQALLDLGFVAMVEEKPVLTNTGFLALD